MPAMNARFALVLVVLMLAGLLPGAASAQTQNFVNTTNGAIDGSTTCAAPLVRTFSVAPTFTLGDVDIGLRGPHTWRGDVRVTLQHPDGTRVQVVNGAGNVSGDNYNWRLSDQNTTLVNTDGDTANHQTGTVNGGFEHQFRPSNPLSAFNGKASNGTWRLEICDIFPQADNGTFFHSELYLTPLTGSFANLSLTKTVNDDTPDPNQQIIYTLRVSNAANSTQNATPTITDVLPAGVTYLSHAGAGTYSPASGAWSPGTIAAGQNRQLTITARVDAGAGSVIVNYAEITSSNRNDPNSTPNNGSSNEDDDADATITVNGTRSAGTPPTLVCPDNALTFNWAGRSWPPGTTSQNYTLAGLGAFNWSINSPAPFISIAAYGGATPRISNAAQGIDSLVKGIDFASRTQVSTTTITLGAVVDGAQFTIIDVDFGADDFADRVRVFGRRGGAGPVIPVLTNGLANYVIGNQAFGDQPSGLDQANGNVVVTFSAPIDEIVIEYGNHSAAPADPDGQAISMSGSISICEPQADLAVAKTSEVIEDPVTGTDDPFHIPGARMRYCILISNTGSASANNIVASDPLPAATSYVVNTLRSGSSCANASTPEDDDAAGPDDSDTIGASFSGGTVQIDVSKLADGQTAAVTFEATIK